VSDLRRVPLSVLDLAISASGPSYRLSRKRAEEIVPDLAAASAGLSAQLG